MIIDPQSENHKGNKAIPLFIFSCSKGNGKVFELFKLSFQYVVIEKST